MRRKNYLISIIGVFLVGLMMFITAGCGDIETPTEGSLPPDTTPTAPQNTTPKDTTPPTIPRGFKAILGDNQVTLTWYANAEPDLAGYKVKRRGEDSKEYEAIGGVTKNIGINNDGMVEYVDRTVKNGKTYWYVVTSYDNAKPEANESAASAPVGAIPRPQGIVTLSLDEGFNFKKRQRVPGDSPLADIAFDIAKIELRGIFWRVEGKALIMILANDELRIQDMGFTKDLSDIGLAPFFPDGDKRDINDPVNGWENAVKEIRIGHTYALWFDHDGVDKDLYGKFRIKHISDLFPPSVTMEWALQEKPNTPQLAPARMP